MDPKAMMKLSYGLFVLTAKTGEKINGCITNTAIQVTTEPNQIAFAVNKANLTHDMVKESGRFVISIISEKAEFSLFKHFGFQSGRNVDKFADFDSYKLTESGIPYITAGINAYVTDMEVLTEDASATYAYYHANIKPKPQEVKKTEEGKVIWRCTICGYEYEGDPIPDDFICPWCKHPASDFERVVL